jgi:hypothetical protein
MEPSLMSEPGEIVTPADKGRRLADAIRDVRNATADREDVVVDMREAQRMRLELLAAELAPVFADVPADNEWFDFAISSGLQPRLWIDAVSHVSMGRDRRTYRFLRDTRLGRIVLAESTDMKPVADQVTRYVAERIVERQRMMEGTATPALVANAAPAPSSVVPTLVTEPRTGLPEIRIEEGTRSGRWQAFWAGLGLVFAGGLAGLFLMMAAIWLWSRVGTLGINL